MNLCVQVSMEIIKTLHLTLKCFLHIAEFQGKALLVLGEV